MNKLINIISNLSTAEWIVVAVVILALIFVISHPIITIIALGAAWYGSTKFRNAAKAFINKWK